MVFSVQKNLRYVLLPGRWPVKEGKGFYEKAFECWDNVWSEAFFQLHNDRTVRSDAFTRQDLVGSVFLGDKCLAMCFFRFVDPKSAAFAKDSYFANWGPEDLRTLCQDGDNIVVSSNFTIAPSVRGAALGFSLKEVLAGITVRTFMDLGADSMASALRCDRAVNRVGYMWGGVPISQNVPSGHGDTVDLVGFFRSKIINHPVQELTPVVEELWENRIVVDSIQNPITEHKKAV